MCSRRVSAAQLISFLLGDLDIFIEINIAIIGISLPFLYYGIFNIL
jgi:hypothetical protein